MKASSELQLMAIAKRTKVHRTTVLRRIRRFEAETGVTVLVPSAGHRNRHAVLEDYVLKIAS